jgi:hypothetical protein
MVLLYQQSFFYNLGGIGGAPLSFTTLHVSRLVTLNIKRSTYYF